jgi:hypothetical protein
MYAGKNPKHVAMWLHPALSGVPMEVPVGSDALKLPVSHVAPTSSAGNVFVLFTTLLWMQVWLDEEWTPQDVHKDLGAFAGQVCQQLFLSL